MESIPFVPIHWSDGIEWPTEDSQGTVVEPPSVIAPDTRTWRDIQASEMRRHQAIRAATTQQREAHLYVHLAHCTVNWTVRPPNGDGLVCRVDGMPCFGKLFESTGHLKKHLLNQAHLAYDRTFLATQPLVSHPALPVPPPTEEVSSFTRAVETIGLQHEDSLIHTSGDPNALTGDNQIASHVGSAPVPALVVDGINTVDDKIPSGMHQVDDLSSIADM